MHLKLQTPFNISRALLDAAQLMDQLDVAKQVNVIPVWSSASRLASVRLMPYCTLPLVPHIAACKGQHAKQVTSWQLDTTSKLPLSLLSAGDRGSCISCRPDGGLQGGHGALQDMVQATGCLLHLILEPLCIRRRRLRLRQSQPRWRPQGCHCPGQGLRLSSALQRPETAPHVMHMTGLSCCRRQRQLRQSQATWRPSGRL